MVSFSNELKLQLIELNIKISEGSLKKKKAWHGLFIIGDKRAIVIFFFFSFSFFFFFYKDNSGK